MADTLPDAPWAKGGGDLPDAPWSGGSSASTPAPDDHGLAERRKLSPLGKAINPITSYPETYMQMQREGRETTSRGIEQLSNPSGLWDVAKGVGNVAVGQIGYWGAPINAAYRSIAGQPVEDVTGIPREYTEFAGQLATPGLGLRALSPKVPGAPLKPSEMQPSVAGRAVVADSEKANELNIPLSRGQATQDLDAIRYEDLAARGAYGPKAQEEAVRFFDEQFKAMQSAATNVGETLARTGPKTADVGESATSVNTELLSTAEKARIVTAEAERRAVAEAAAYEGMIGDQGRVLGEVVQAGRAPVQNIREAGETVGQGVRDAAEAARQKYKGQYSEAFSLPGQFHAGAFENIGSRIRSALTLSDNPVIVDDTTKIAMKALEDVDKIAGLKFKNAADPYGAPNPENIVAVNLKGVDQARKLLVARYQQAKAAGRSTQDFSDQRAMERIIDAFDDHIERSIANGLFSGDPRALQALQEARSSFANYRRTYRPNAGDDVSQALNRIVTRNATPEEIGNMITGSGKLGNAGLPVRLAERLRNIFGEDSDVWSAVRQSVWQKASQARTAAGEFDAAKAANSIDNFTNTSLARTMFAPHELAAMRSHARGVQQLERVIETLPEAQRAQQVRSAYQKFFEPEIGGSQATVFRRIMDGTASPQETANAVFGAVNSSSSGNVVRMLKAIESIAGPESESMSAIRQGVWQKLTKDAAGKDQPGQQKVAQAINEFLNGKGQAVARQLYSPAELGLMKKYADAIKLTVIPPRAATRSDTTPGLLSVLHKYSAAISSAVGGIFGHGPVGVVAGYGVGKLLQKGSDAVQEMKELNRIRSQFEPPSARRVTPPRNRPASPFVPAAGPLLTNPPRIPALFSGLQGPVPSRAQEEQPKP